MSFQPDHVLKLEGVRCPDYIEAVRRFIRNDCEVNESVYIVADEPSSPRDTKRYCEFIGHELLLSQTDEKNIHHFIIKKNG